MMTLGVLYGKIIFILRRPAPINHNEQPFQTQRRRERDIRITKLLVTVVIAFALCVLPNHLGTIIQHLFQPPPESGEAAFIHYFTLVPYPLHCATNPVIYSIVDNKFRRDIKLLFGCKRKRAPAMSLYYSEIAQGSAENYCSSMSAVTIVRKISGDKCTGRKSSIDRSKQRRVSTQSIRKNSRI